MGKKEKKIEEIYSLVGRTHRACQLFEYKLAEVLYEWRIHSCPQKPLEPIKAIEEINKIHKSTFDNTVLGRKITKLQNEGIFKEDIIELLKKFKDHRNNFIHDFHYDYGIELMLIEGNFEKGTFKKERIKAAYCKLKKDLNEIIHNMEKAVNLCKKITNAIRRLGEQGRLGSGLCGKCLGSELH